MISPIDTFAGRSQDFARFVELQRQFADVELRLADIETAMNRAAQKAAAGVVTDYVVLQEERAQIEEQLKALFTAHPDWREGQKKSLTTPYGSVEQRSVTELEVPNPAVTVTLLEARGNADSTFDQWAFLHVRKEPNLEALEGLGDDDLAKLGVRRVRSERVTVKAPKISAKKVAKTAAAAQTKPA